jgi:exodeoxyribonuclease V beta subunit
VTAAFDVCGPLPQGTTVLEASAGTGKTFTIAALATRYVAEGVAELSELMLVTFGRAATSELRDRVRERLVSAERALRDPAAWDPDDELVTHLADVDDAELARRRARLTRALAEFDAATIATTHGFCQQMLASLGVSGDVDADAVLVPDIADLVDEVVDDLYLQRYAGEPSPALSVAKARLVARAAVGDHQAELEPVRAEPGSLPGHRYAFADAVRGEVRRRKRSRRLLDYDDLLVLLRDALTDPVHGAAAADRVRARYRIVMVDEFQDTDPVQWQILRTAFHGHRTLVLIGDPKQAIYAFRGADVVTYLSAANEATTKATLARSWRSDEPLLRGLDHLFGQAALGDPGIVVRPVEARHRDRRLDGGAPVRLRHVTREAFGLKGTKTPAVGALRDLIARDVAEDVVRQLQQTKLLDDEAWRPLQPGDIAVLAYKNADAARVRDALVAAGVPAVVSGLSSVFGTPAARHWLTLLAALEQPGHGGRAAALALTPFLGWDAARLASADDAERDALSDRIRAWAGLLAERGVAALTEAVSADGLAERLLRTASGERVLTDLRHIGQALHVAAVAERLGPAALTEWLRRRIDEASEDYTEERSRRLETDAAAVQVVTIHASKGLEFPVVYAPFTWDRYDQRDQEVLSFHDDAGRRILHVGGAEDAHYDIARQRHLDEERGEDLRLLYVALTRARCQVVAWWAPSYNSPCGALTRVLFGGHGPGEEPPQKVSTAKDETATAALSALAARADGRIVVEPVTRTPEGTRWSPPEPERPEMSVARFDRHLDFAWRRTSYTGLTAAAHEPGADSGAGVGSEPETTGVQDEVDLDLPDVPPGTPDPRWPPSPMADLPGGAAFGTLVHGVLERVDPSAADLDAELLARCRDAVSARVPGVDAAALATGLAPVLATPLGPLAGGLTLADLPPADRLVELEFELPLAGGDAAVLDGAPLGGATLADVAALLREHLPADDPFAGYPHLLGARQLRGERLRGYLTGSLDAVLRVRSETGPRYLVVDYKTNRLAPPGEPLTTWHYRPEAMTQAMLAAHYPLQLLLYAVALHRFLRWRQPGYDPSRHLGGGLYLFVRGMCGPNTPVVDGQPCGVMGWRPPASLVVALSGLLEGRRS